MDLQLSGKVAIVTGAGQHIGRQIALTLAQEGARVVVNDYFEDRATKVAGEITDAGGEAIGIRADVRDYDDVEAMVKKALSEFGRVDILVNNAGILPAGLRSEAVIVPFIETDRKAWDSDVDVCLYGAFNCCKVVMGHMVKQKYGKIVSILSDAGRIGEPGQATYSAAKAGIAGFSKALAKEAGRYCVNVNCVSIGSTPPSDGSWDKFLADNLDKVIKAYPIGRGLGRLEVPSDVANTVVYLCSDASVFITGQVISVSGGYTMIG